MSLKDKFNDGQSADIRLYEKPGFARNVDFVLADGRRFFRNYAYLTGADYNPAENMIVLVFTSDSVTIKGRNLAKLYAAFLKHSVETVRCTEPRYLGTKGEAEVVVGEIVLVGNA